MQSSAWCTHGGDIFLALQIGRQYLHTNKSPGLHSVRLLEINSTAIPFQFYQTLDRQRWLHWSAMNATTVNEVLKEFPVTYWLSILQVAISISLSNNTIVITVGAKYFCIAAIIVMLCIQSSAWCAQMTEALRLTVMRIANACNCRPLGAILIME